MLTVKESLKIAFQAHSGPYFRSGLNWLEICSLVNILTVRWHGRIETVNGERWQERESYGAPLFVLKEMGLRPGRGVTDTSYNDYGRENAVTSLDQRVAKLKRARINWVLRVGSWRNAGELALLTGYGIYNTHNVESEMKIFSRLTCGNLDYLARGRYARIATEIFKRSAALRDEIAFPYVSETAQEYWNSLIDMRSANIEGTTVEWLANLVVTPTVEWSWGINIAVRSGSGTATGLRTVSSCWRTICNTKWSDFAIAKTKRLGSADYIVDDRSGVWTREMWVQEGAGEDDCQLESCLMLINQESEDWGLSYQPHPMHNQLKGYCWVVDSLVACHVARRAGWTDDILSMDTTSQWGWGVPVRVKDFERGELKTLVIPKKTGNIMCSHDYHHGTYLMRGKWDDKIGGLRKHYLGRHTGLDPNYMYKKESGGK